MKKNMTDIPVLTLDFNTGIVGKIAFTLMIIGGYTVISKIVSQKKHSI